MFDLEGFSKQDPLRNILSLFNQRLDHPPPLLSSFDRAVACFLPSAEPKSQEYILRALRELVPTHDHPGTLLQDGSDWHWKLIERTNSYVDSGNYVEAVSVAALFALSQLKHLGPSHLFLGQALCWLAGLYEHLGNRQKTMEWSETALGILDITFRQTRLSEEDYASMVQTVDRLARCHETIGNFEQSEMFFLRAYALRFDRYGPTHAETGIAVRNLAGLCRTQGHYRQALNLYNYAYKILKKALGKDDFQVAVTLTDLGNLTRFLTKAKQARLYLERALKIHRKALVPDQRELGVVQYSLAGIYWRMGKIEQALTLAEDSVAVLKKACGPNHADVARALNQLAICLAATSDFTRAEQLLGAALEMLETSLGNDNLFVAATLHDLARAYYKTGQVAKALHAAERSLEIHYARTQQMFKVAPAELSKLGSMSELLIILRELHSITTTTMDCYKNDTAVRNGLTWLLRCKGLALDEQMRVNELIRQGQPEEEKQRWYARQSLLQELAHHILSGPHKLRLSRREFRQKAASLYGELNLIERTLQAKTHSVSETLSNAELTAEDLLLHIPHKTAVIEYATIQGVGTDDEERMIAFVIIPQQAVQLVDLGAVHTLTESVQAVRTCIQAEVTMFEKGNAYFDRSVLDATADALKCLYRRIWEPLENTLGCTDCVYICPDGQLNLVPFAALMNDDGCYLIEQYGLAYLSMGRELVVRRTNKSQRTIEFIGMGNPTYGHEVPGLKPLPKTQQELKNILPLLRENTVKRVLVGRDATKHALAVALRQDKPKILHLAVHGYFRETVPSWYYSPKSMKGNDLSLGNPLLLSGLVFAISEDASPSPHSNDSAAYLTALEVLGMDLDGCELVVLSACHTGVGITSVASQGVYGLRSAFFLAGASNLVMSLWGISEEDAPDQLTKFYTYLRGHSPALALQKAQRDTIELLREEMGSAPVGLWAPFIVQGASAFDSF